MLPRNWIEHHVPNISPEAWTGDVWKLGFELSKTIGIDFKILKLDHGVGIFKVLNNKATLKDLQNELKNKEFKYFYDNFYSLPVINLKQAINWLTKVD